MALKETVRKAMGESGVNAFAKRAGIDAGNLSRILKGQQPSAAVLKKIADASAGVSADELLYAAGYTGTDTRTVRIAGTVSGGMPINAFEEDLGSITLDGSLKGDAEDYFALRVSGNSMDAAHIPDGCIIIAQKRCDIQNGDIGVFIIDGDATVKQFKKQDGKIFLIPKSTDDAHKVQVYDRYSDIKVLGKVKKAVIDI